jgi:hypothetical protein
MMSTPWGRLLSATWASSSAGSSLPWGFKGAVRVGCQSGLSLSWVFVRGLFALPLSSQRIQQMWPSLPWARDSHVQLFDVLQDIFCNSTPNSRMVCNCCSRRDSLISEAFPCGPAQLSAKIQHSPFGTTVFQNYFFCDRLLLELLLLNVVCPVLE